MKKKNSFSKKKSLSLHAVHFFKLYTCTGTAYNPLLKYVSTPVCILNLIQEQISCSKTVLDNKKTHYKM